MVAPDCEKVLVEKAKKDLDAFQTLYDRFLPRIYAYVCYRVGHVQDAEDITSAVFLAAVERMTDFVWRGEGSFSAWLFRIAHDQVVSYHRTTSSRASTISLDELPDLHAHTLLPTDALQQKELFASLRMLILGLSPRRQEVISLKFFGGLRNKEIALVLGLDERSVASHLCRAIEDLHRAYLDRFVRIEEENHDSPA